MRHKFKPEYGQGTFYEEKIGDRKYYVYEWSSPNIKRKPRKRFPYTKEGEKEREQFAKNIIAKMAAGIQPQSTETFGEWLLTYVETYRKVNVDIDSYKRLLQYCKNIPITFANTQLDRISSEQLQTLITGMQTDPSFRHDGKNKPLSYSTVKKIYELIFASLDKARVLRKIQFNPMEAVDKPTSTVKIEKQVFSDDELKRFLWALKQLTTSNSRMRIRRDYINLFFFLYAFGLRIGELLALKWTDVDLEHQIIRVNKSKKSNKAGQCIGKTKTAKGNRTIPILLDSAYNRLAKMQETAKDDKGFLFPTSSGKALGYFQVKRVFNSTCALAGIKNKTIHELRHTFGTKMARAVGVDGKPMPIAELSRIMGHSKISTTQNFYVHSDEAQNEALLKSFANLARRRSPIGTKKNRTGAVTSPKTDD